MSHHPRHIWPCNKGQSVPDGEPHRNFPWDRYSALRRLPRSSIVRHQDCPQARAADWGRPSPSGSADASKRHDRNAANSSPGACCGVHPEKGCPSVLSEFRRGIAIAARAVGNAFVSNGSCGRLSFICIFSYLPAPHFKYKFLLTSIYSYDYIPSPRSTRASTGDASWRSGVRRPRVIASSAALPGGLGAPPYGHYDPCAGSLLDGPGHRASGDPGSQARPGSQCGQA